MGWLYVLRHGFRAQETKKGFFVFWNLRVSVHDSCITFVAIHARVPFCGRCMMPEAGLEAMGKGRAPEQCVALRVFELPMYNISIYSEEMGSRSTCSFFRATRLTSLNLCWTQSLLLFFPFLSFSRTLCIDLIDVLVIRRRHNAVDLYCVVS
jgi:hypothetical protein